MNDKKVKFGFLGCGKMGQLAHIANYTNLPDVELVGLVDLRYDTAVEVAKKYGIQNVYKDLKDMLDNTEIAAVVAITGFNLHHAIVPEILNAKKHCLTEKPISIKSSTAENMSNLAKKNGVVYQIGYMKRSDPASIFMKQKIGEWMSGKPFGELNYLRVTMPPGDWLFGIDPHLNKKDKPQKGGVGKESYPEWMDETVGKEYIAFINYYIHQINMIRYLLNEDFTVEYIDSKGKLLVAKSFSGVIISVEMSTYNVRDEWHEFYDAHFDKGFIALSLPAPMARQQSGKVKIYENTDSSGRYTDHVFPPKWSMAEQSKHFVEAIKSNIPCISPAEEAVKDLIFAEEFIKHRFKK